MQRHGEAVEASIADGTEFEFFDPQPDRAKQLAGEARTLVGEGRLREAILRLELAIGCDQIGCLSGYNALRALVCRVLDDPWPTLAIDFYDRGCEFRRQKRYKDAKIAWLEAHALDPLFLWPANNYAWLLATSMEPGIRDGREALKYALHACRLSRWNCWAFIGTLAAAYAECGDFSRAVGWVSVSLEMAPPDHKPDELLMLQQFQARQPFTDRGMRPAAGLGS
jgi:tetratricopeptide (TPR) repeat protein